MSGLDLREMSLTLSERVSIQSEPLSSRELVWRLNFILDSIQREPTRCVINLLIRRSLSLPVEYSTSPAPIGKIGLVYVVHEFRVGELG